MKSAIKKALAVALMVPVLALGVTVLFGGDAAYAIDVPDSINQGIGATGGDSGNSTADLNNIFKTVVNVLLYVIGGISVIMLIIGGIRYTISGGDQSHVTAAKNTIMYALIGLVIAFLAYAIINWVLGAIAGDGAA